MDVLQALLLGLVVGLLFALFRLVPPAPPTLAGIAGIVGIFAGWVAVTRILDHFWPPSP